MKISNLEIKKVLKNTTVALLTGTVLLTTTINGLTTEVNASVVSTQESYYVMNYFTNELNDEVESYLDKSKSSSNLNSLLADYKTLYEYINYSKKVRSTYFNNLNEIEQAELRRYLLMWGNEIYDLYKNQSYFTTNCNNKLGFTLKYTSYQSGYDYDHNKTMEYYTEKLNEQIQEYLDKNNSETNLKNSLTVYESLVKFVKGNLRVHNYTYPELTITEQEDLNSLLIKWTYDIMDEYEQYSYYSSICGKKIGWEVNIYNLNYELGNTMENIYNESVLYPNYNQNTPVYSPVVPSTPVINQTPQIQINSNAQITPNVQNNTRVNTTVNKNWAEAYINPSINTSRGEPDYVPYDINNMDRYNDNERYYNQYNNPYYNQYNDEYKQDYVPMYTPR